MSLGCSCYIVYGKDDLQVIRPVRPEEKHFSYAIDPRNIVDRAERYLDDIVSTDLPGARNDYYCSKVKPSNRTKGFSGYFLAFPDAR
jgi:hypothetical protein